MNAAHFAAGDLDALYARARDAAAELVSEPTDQPWGARDCVFRDPSDLIRVDQD